MNLPFPSTGPGTDPVFDGHSLRLLKETTAPSEFLERNVERLGKELETSTGVMDSSLDVPWPVPEDSPLGQMLTREALIKWDYDLFKLKEVSGGHTLVYLSHGFIRMFSLVEVLCLDETILHRYLTQIVSIVMIPSVLGTLAIGLRGILMARVATRAGFFVPSNDATMAAYTTTLCMQPMFCTLP